MLIIGGRYLRDITLSNVKKVEVDCLSCAITSGLIAPDG